MFWPRELRDLPALISKIWYRESFIKRGNSFFRSTKQPWRQLPRDTIAWLCITWMKRGIEFLWGLLESKVRSYPPGFSIVLFKDGSQMKKRIGIRPFMRLDTLWSHSSRNTQTRFTKLRLFLEVLQWDTRRCYRKRTLTKSVELKWRPNLT